MLNLPGLGDFLDIGDAGPAADFAPGRDGIQAFAGFPPAPGDAAPNPDRPDFGIDAGLFQHFCQAILDLTSPVGLDQGRGAGVEGGTGGVRDMGQLPQGAQGGFPLALATGR